MSTPRKGTATWAITELKKIEELYDYPQCTQNIRDALIDEVFKQLPQQAVTEKKECSTKTPKVGKRRKTSSNT